MLAVFVVLSTAVCPDVAQADDDSTSTHSKAIVSMRGATEFGFVSGYKRYGRNDSPTNLIPTGVFFSYCFSDHQFIQPFATYSFGTKFYFDCGLKYGVFLTQDDPEGWVHYAWHFGIAYQNVNFERKNSSGEVDIIARSGFDAPIDFGIYWQIPHTKTLVTFLATVSVGNDNNNTLWGWGVLTSISIVSKSMNSKK
jgi:hypothetical protein